MYQSRRELGQSGEDYATMHLINAGLDILERNYRCPKGEMDIIAKEGSTIVFVEVRTRSSGRFGWGEETITPQKKARLTRIASYYLKMHGFKKWPPIRFDLIAIRAVNSKDTESKLTQDLYWIRGI